MCKLKSGVVLRDRIFLPEYDSHTDMLDELGIEEVTDNSFKSGFETGLVLGGNGDV